MVVNATVEVSAAQNIGVHANPVVSTGQGDFMTSLRKMYLEPDRLLKEMSDPDIQMITVGNLGVFDKESPGFALAETIYLGRNESVFATYMDILKGKEDLAKKLDQMF